MKDQEIRIALRDAVKYKILLKDENGYIFNKPYLTKLSKGIKEKGKYPSLIKFLWKANYFEIPRTSKEVANIITLITLPKDSDSRRTA